MYTPPHFSEIRPEELHALIRQSPLATLVGGDLECSHLPLFLDVKNQVLRGHLARANPHWRKLADTDALAIFHGPEHYISPSWYPAKQELGKVAPTWNYVVVHVRGPVRVIEDPEFILDNVTELTAQQESEFAEPWAVSDAPPDFIEGMARAIIGIQMQIATIEGKWKLNQNRTAADRDGVRQGLAKLGTGRSLAMLQAMKGLS